MREFGVIITATFVLILAGCSEQKSASTQTDKQAVVSAEVTVGEKPIKSEDSSRKIETHAPKNEPSLTAGATTKLAMPSLATKEQKSTPKRVDAASLFKACAGCHGANGKKRALGKSQPIAGWSVARLSQAIEAYKTGSRNKYGMGAVMKGQVSKLNKDEIAALSEYISHL